MSPVVCAKILYRLKRIRVKVFTKTCKKCNDGLNDGVKLARCTIHFHGNDLEAEAERSLQASIQSVYKGGGRRLKDAKPNSQASTTRSTLKFNLYKRGYNLREHASSRQFGVMSKKPHTSLASFVDRFLCSV
jgi:hypothetical protein